MSEINLLPRADLPVIWDAFKAKTEEVRQIAETLVVTDVTQKEEMALARKTRLTLREIRIAVEHKRVELGEGHLKEIQKVNGAARAIREFIEPLEARLLHQEGFAERFEADRIVELTKIRNDEVRAIWPGCPGDFGKMSQDEYTALITRLRKESEEMAEYKRKQAEAEKQLAEVRAEAQKRAIELQLELKAESDRLKAEANAILNAKLEQQRKEAEALEVKRRAEYEQERAEYERKAQETQRQRAAEDAARRQEQAEAAEQKRVQDEWNATQRAAQVELDRIRDEKLAKLEAELAVERAAKQAEADAARKLALAPDVEKLWAFAGLLRGVDCSGVTSEPGKNLVQSVLRQLRVQAEHIERFCQAEGLTTK